jgi:hypothetical protein
MKALRIAALLVSLSCALPCSAHVGSPDVYFQGQAGPYHLVVSVQTPQMIPGVAEIQIRSSEPGVRQVKIVPLYIVGAGSKYPPPPDVLKPSKDDPQFFSGSLWLMATGSWQVRIEADGEKGSGTLAVPVAAFARNTLPMQRNLGVILFALMVLLVCAIVSILGAASREGQLEPGRRPEAQQKRRARIVMATVTVIVLGLLTFGGWWWKTAAADRSNRMIYKRPKLSVSLLPGGKMNLGIGESEWHSRRPEAVATNLIPDHGHLMHLFLIRMPQMDRLYHLHPARDNSGAFVDDLPPISSGHYQIFADIVRESGFPDTLIAEMDFPETAGRPLAGDDSAAEAPSLAQTAPQNLIAPLSGGARMVWERAPGPLASNRLLWFRFRIKDASGKPVQDLEPYMGMSGHAEFVRSDFSVFAHVHPDGSAPMAAVLLANANLPGASPDASLDASASQAHSMPGMDMPGMPMTPNSPEVSFPYGFPKPGLYRIFIQVKRAGRVETGVFDAQVN